MISTHHQVVQRNIRFFALLIALPLLPLALNAQDESSARVFHYENQIKTNPIIMLFPVWNFQYERFIKANKSLQLGYSNLDQAIFIDTKMIGNILTLDYKYYTKSRRKSASYLSPYLRYQNIEYDGNGDRILQKKLGGGADFGKVVYLTEWLVVDLAIGVNFVPTGYKTIETDGEVDIELPKTLYGFGPRIGIAIGISF